MSDNVPFWYSPTEARRTLEQLSRTTQVGTLDQPMARNYFGLNHRQLPGLWPANNTTTGITFFTRPQLNLSRDNIIHDRMLAQLLVDDPYHPYSYIRNVLDPKIADTEKSGRSALCDPRQAFITILTNTAESVTGWRDVAPPTYSSPEGMYKESLSFVDGPSKDYTTYDIQASFRNVMGDPVTDLLMFWCHYQSLAFEGVYFPYPEFWIDNEFDFNTRIYHLSMDPTKRWVWGIRATGASEPVSAPTGAGGNYERANYYNRSTDTVSAQFRSHGCIYQDPILVEEFNAVVSIFNEHMMPGVKERVYQKIPNYALTLFNGLGYPWIEPQTGELQWWVSKEDFNSLLPSDQARILSDEAAAAQQPGGFVRRN